MNTVRLGICTVLILLAGAGCASDRKTYPTPQAAADSLAAAMRAGSDKDVSAIFGKDGEQLIHSGDPTQDRNHVQRFVQNYDQRHELIPADDGSVTLCIGPNQWPFPIPLVKDAKNDTWTFDTARGRDEILNRRIGRNELSAIKVCQAIVDAEQDYVSRSVKSGGLPEYAGRFLSTPGKTDGLYWPTKENEPLSPLGELVANAVDEGYQPGHQLPYHGYYYRILKRQGDHANGGALDYVVNGHLIAGFAVIARPAEYGNSGVMSFIVNYEGTVYQRDLGQDTAKAVKAITSFDPGPGWNKVEIQP